IPGRRLGVEGHRPEGRVFGERRDRADAAVPVLAEEPDAQGRVAGLLETRLQARDPDIGRKRALEPRQEARPGEPPLADDPEQPAALLRQRRDLVVVERRPRLLRFFRGPGAALLEELDLAAAALDPRVEVAVQEDVLRQENQRGGQGEPDDKEDRALVSERAAREIEPAGSHRPKTAANPGSSSGREEIRSSKVESAPKSFPEIFCGGTGRNSAGKGSPGGRSVQEVA